MLLVCSNGNPVRIRTAKYLSGNYLRRMGYCEFKPYVCYDICHTKSRRVRLVKAYRYADDSYDISFYTAGLKPIEGVGTIIHVSNDPALRQFYAKELNRLLNKAIFLVNARHTAERLFAEELPF